MEHEPHLSGRCHCGRNRYIVEIPKKSSDLTVFLDNSHASRLAHAAPLAVFLRVPITLYHSTTLAYYDDETHNDIRKTYQLQNGRPDSWQPSRRQFCGFCGTQLSSWSDERPGEADYISVTLGSMRDRDVERLHDMGVLASEEDTEDGGASSAATSLQHQATISSRGQDSNVTTIAGAPWFEAMVQDTPLGRMRKQKGGHVSDDGRTRVQWEIVEVEGGTTFTSSTAATTTESTSSTSKRKLQDTDQDENDRDTEMSSGLRG